MFWGRRLGSLVVSGVAIAALAPAVLPAAPAQAAVSVKQVASTSAVFPQDFPDPSVLRLGSSYLAYGTNGSEGNIQMLRSTDLTHWTRMRDALPKLPAWALPGHTWAPTVLARGRRYVMWFVARDRATGRQCIGRAAANSASGPFVSPDKTATICQTADHGGSIDPSLFTDSNGRVYLLWKTDDNAIGRRPHLLSAALNPDGLTFASWPVDVLQSDQGWEWPLIEAPTMVHVGTDYYLFYSGSWWESPTYGIGYARCAGPMGPCLKATTAGPWMASHGTTVGVGGQDVFQDPAGRWWIAYSGWDPGRVGYAIGGARRLRVEGLKFVNGQPAWGR
jgi:beta-xylosidase